MPKLNSPNANVDGSPIFNTGDEAAILDFIAHVKALLTDSGFTLIMDEIENNVTYMANKSVKEVYSDLQ